jgi:hypothetical protein
MGEWLLSRRDRLIVARHESAWSHEVPAQGGAKLRLSRGFPRGHAQPRNPQEILARIV